VSSEIVAFLGPNRAGKPTTIRPASSESAAQSICPPGRSRREGRVFWRSRMGGTVRAQEIHLGPGGTLTGNGTVIADIVNFGGTLVPGELRILGDYGQVSGRLILNVDGLQHDVLKISGGLALEPARQQRADPRDSRARAGGYGTGARPFWSRRRPEHRVLGDSGCATWVGRVRGVATTPGSCGSTRSRKSTLVLLGLDPPWRR
jgi:hypothetical protein